MFKVRVQNRSTDPFEAMRTHIVRTKDDVLVTDNDVLVLNTYAPLHPREIESAEEHGRKTRDPEKPIVIGYSRGEWIRFTVTEIEDLVPAETSDRK